MVWEPLSDFLLITRPCYRGGVLGNPKPLQLQICCLSRSPCLRRALRVYWVAVNVLVLGSLGFRVYGLRAPWI